MALLSKVIGNEYMQRILEEYSRLKDKCYLDNAGASLYPNCLLQLVNKDLSCNVYMNPHSDKYTKDCIDQIRSAILNFFNTDSSTYSVIFTSGTTQSLKLVVESFQFASDENVENCGSFVYLQDNHTSVIGLREIAAEKNADIIHIPHQDFLEALCNSNTCTYRKGSKSNCNTLLAYPAQSNFNGYKYPIDCIEKVKAGCLNNHIKKHLSKLNCNWYVLLDAASFLSTNKLDLSVVQPDFLCLSFYKIFGYPTGLGALLVKNSSTQVLSQKSYFGGGTVDIVLSNENYHVKREEIYERFEDGTVPFLSIIALKHCFDTMNKLVPKIVNNNVMDTISWHTYLLAKDLYDQLDQLYHRTGCKAVQFYMDSNFTDIKEQGAIVTFSIARDAKTHIGYTEFQHMADLFNISVRTGCFCNSGSCQRHLNATNKDMKDMYKAGHKCGDEVDLINGHLTGAVRVSFGYYNTFQDVDKLIAMINQCFVKTKITKPIRLRNKYDTDKEKTQINDNTTKLLSENGLSSKINIVDDTYLFDSDIRLSEIAIFPVKSCAAYKIKSFSSIGVKGFEYDREWMIVKDNGVCLTQKQNTRMCLIKPSIDFKKRQLILNCDGMSPISLPLDYSAAKKNNVSFCQSKVCADVIQGYDCGDEVADWVSNALEVSFLRMVRQSNDPRVHKKKVNGEQKLLSFSNQAQFLLINKATIQWLSDKIRDPNFSHNLEDLTDRFRGNIILEMAEELVERDWNKLIIGKHEFKVDGQCSRCQMVCIDQNTGEKTVEPLRTISEEFAGKLRFGIYLTYIGTVDGSKDRLLKINSPVRPIINDDNISRKDHFDLSPYEFRDALSVRYHRTPISMPKSCDGCGNNDFNIDHALCCKTGGLITRRHNEIRDLFCELGQQAWGNVVKEPIITEGDNGLRGDLACRGVWVAQREALFDIRVVDTDAPSYISRPVASVLKSAESEKQRKYANACELRHATFTPLITSVDGVFAPQLATFVKHLGEALASRWDRSLSCVLGWLRARIITSIIRATSMCIRGTRHKWKPAAKLFGFGDGAALPHTD